MKIGLGFDAHRLAAGRDLVLGGVKIPFARGLLGHSDADVLTHSVMDAVLGACALGDIGRHFPDTDAAYKGADSLRLLALVRQKAAAAGWAVGNIDAVVMAEQPRLTPYFAEMREKIAGALGIPAERVSLKATTTEGLGFVGREEGIAAQAVVLMEEINETLAL
ncbi:MAG: 2-C-methyl-D-erythritol 2,4-cyclodiphosphate synthase [Gracilibacteraceae bacterium]|jgi:2-C-methyl-D-erythritol 2,4-cyclodiphosphate synthase|nr:2-C-methyl-D-erythritol 2,4-cyclodiphosphate synthase [Gracilibacteraceae bacterium]